MNYVIKNNGIHTEKSYPYHARRGACRNFASGIGARKWSRPTLSTHSLRSRFVWQGVVQIPANAAAIAAYVAQHSPVSIAVDASHWQYYQRLPLFPSASILLIHFVSSGIITHSCTKTIDHAVLIVGYGVSARGMPYWIIKNSCALPFVFYSHQIVSNGSLGGTWWGLKGYILVERGSADVCGVNQYPVAATV